MLNILVIHYNTPKLTECLVKSINKFVGANCCIYIFDNSDKNPFTYKQDNITVFDNTTGQIINFDEELKKYPNRGGEGSDGHFVSFKHCISVDKCFDLINDGFILLDSDILLKKDISCFWDDNVFYSGEIKKQFFGNLYRLLPFICFINVKKLLPLNIRFFNKNKMHGLYGKGKENLYDTGASFYEETRGLKHNTYKIDDYIVHYKGGSWKEYDGGRNEKFHGYLSVEEWLGKYKYFYMKDNKLIITMTSWKQRISNVPKVLDSIYKQTKKPDKIVINLSSEEFPNKENDLPNDVVSYLEAHDEIEIYWIDGKNRKQWKKIIPTLLRYPDDWVICIDDDRIYPSNFIECLWKKHCEYPDNAITLNRGYKVNGYLQHCGHGTLSTLSFFNGFKGINLEELYDRTESSDTFFNYMLSKNGHELIFCGATDLSKTYNEVSPLSKSNNTKNTTYHIDTWKWLCEKYGNVIEINKKPKLKCFDDTDNTNNHIIDSTYGYKIDRPMVAHSILKPAPKPKRVIKKTRIFLGSGLHW